MSSEVDADRAQRGVSREIHGLMAGVTGLMATAAAANTYYLGVSAAETQSAIGLVAVSVFGWMLVTISAHAAPKLEEVLTA